MNRLYFYNSNNLPKQALANPSIANLLGIKLQNLNHSELLNRIEIKLNEMIKHFFHDNNLIHNTDIIILNKIKLNSSFEEISIGGLDCCFSYNVINTTKFLTQMGMDEITSNKFLRIDNFRVIICDGIADVEGNMPAEMRRVIENLINYNPISNHSKLSNQILTVAPIKEYAKAISELLYIDYLKIKHKAPEFIVISTNNKLSHTILNNAHENKDYQAYLAKINSLKLSRKLAKELLINDISKDLSKI